MTLLIHVNTIQSETNNSASNISMQLSLDGILGVADYVSPCESDSGLGDGFEPGEWGRRIGETSRSTYILPHSEHDSFPDISSYEESLDNPSNEETPREIGRAHV